jgi:hypothetical protein
MIYFLDIILRMCGGSRQTWYNGADEKPEIVFHFIRRIK